jgi:hypothetical protein
MQQRLNIHEFRQVVSNMCWEDLEHMEKIIKFEIYRRPKIDANKTTNVPAPQIDAESPGS